ncbi:MAG: hypothetical protein ACE1ZS_09065, partial [Candidatus Poribacteria bacterium]
RWLRNPHHCADLINRMVAFLIKPDSELSLCWIQSTSLHATPRGGLGSIDFGNPAQVGLDRTLSVKPRS